MKDILTGLELSTRKRISEVIYEFNSTEDYKVGKTNLSLLPSIIISKRMYDIKIKDFSVLKRFGFMYDEAECIYFREGDGHKKQPKEIKDLRFSKFTFPYVLDEESLTNKRTLMKYGMLSVSSLINEHKDYSFGVEIETSSGRIPICKINGLNVKCVYDGSIYDDNGNKARGGEYVTGVLRGDAGFIQLKKILSVISKYTRINKTCSVHVHIGNVNFNKLNIIMLWKLSQSLESELYSMMPSSRRKRAHCSPIRNRLKFRFPKDEKSFSKYIDTKYDEVVKIISLGKLNGKTINKALNHPEGHYCGYNTATPRYWWINFVPALFNLKGLDNYTIEFRMHSASTNYTKIRNWILIVMGIVYVAENHHNFIIKKQSFTLEEVMKLAYPKKWKYLSEYINKRKSLFSERGMMAESVEYSGNKGEDYKGAKAVVWDL